MTDKGYSRRAFMRATAQTAALAALPGVAHAQRRSVSGPSADPPALTETPRELTQEPLMHDLALRAVDAAKRAGATYAEARLTRDLLQTVMQRLGRDEESHGIGVRALVNGAWGFAASPYWTADEAAQLGKDATMQARENAKWTTDRLDLAPAPVTTGTWTTPYEIDPFSISLEEKRDFVSSFDYLEPWPWADHRLTANMGDVWCSRQERTIATSEGSLFTQNFYKTGTGPNFLAMAEIPEREMRGAVVRMITGTGWETLSRANLRELGPQLAQLAYDRMQIPTKPVQAGRYTVVFDAYTMAGLIALLFCDATDLDRVLGYEANAGGTSYLGNDPLALLGTYSFGAERLTINAVPAGNRKWDDEGVAPERFPVVTQGVLQGFATTRDRAHLLAPAYQKAGRAVRSNGCATSGTWLDQVTVGPADLILEPGAEALHYEDLVKNASRGMAVIRSEVSADFQRRQVTIFGEVREIVDGKLGAFLSNALIVFDTTEIWKKLIALGGAGSAERREWSWRKGEPTQVLTSVMRTVPAMFKDLAVLDYKRRA